MNTDRKSLLKDGIHSAFVNTPHPGDQNLVDHACERCEEEVKGFKNQRWTDWESRPLDLLLINRDGLAFFSPQAYRYFLPLFMIACIDHYMDADMINISLMRTLTRPREPSPEERNRCLEMMKYEIPGASQGQKDAVRDLLKKVANKTSTSVQQELDLYERRMSAFDHKQLGVIHEFLEYFLDAHSEDFPSGDIQEAFTSVSELRKRP